jgi:hypothetical protein
MCSLQRLWLGEIGAWRPGLRLDRRLRLCLGRSPGLLPSQSVLQLLLARLIVSELPLRFF